MKLYNEPHLPHPDAITAKPHYKPPHPIAHGIQLQHVEVSSIGNLESGTVLARIGSTDEFKELSKHELHAYINFGGYSLTP